MSFNLFRLLPPDEKDRLTATNIANAMRGVPAGVRRRQIAHFCRADLAYGAMARGKPGV